MNTRYAREFELVTELIDESGRLAHELFYSDGFRVFIKDDGSKVTSIDLAVSDYVVNEAQKRGLRVRTEETGSTARYGEDQALDLDPIDGTSDLVKGYMRDPRRCQSAPSLGFWDTEPVIGGVVFPLLGVPPITYLARKDRGAYRKQGGRWVRLEIDTTPTRGIVFVTSKSHTPEAQEMSRTLREMGYTPVSEHGAVFKACGVADGELLRQYAYHGASGLDLPVVGFVSRKAYLHDVAATTCIVREAGGVTTSPENREGKQRWIAANNQAVYDDLMGLAIAS